jgi:outer membrane protein OmpA-like peptidoglycan-associated protein
MRAIALVVLVSLPALAAEQKDNPKCKDSPLFTRMPNSWIHSCDEKTFDSYEFVVTKGKKEAVEGRKQVIRYYPQADVKERPSELQILRNFENAFTKVGGKIIFSEKPRSTMRLTKDGKDLWVEVTAEFTGKYGITMVEKEAMTQDIVADAAAFAADLKATGHVAVYGIYFDSGKADLKPESKPALEEIAKLLAADPSLKLWVVGHTDSEGTAASNVDLSNRRAAAVIRELTGTHKVAANRLAPFGNGPYAPVATNDSEDGRAKNRRVELVKQ